MAHGSRHMAHASRLVAHGSLPIKKLGPPGPGPSRQTFDWGKSKNQEIMEFKGFGPSHNKIEILLDQNEAE